MAEVGGRCLILDAACSHRLLVAPTTLPMNASSAEGARGLTTGSVRVAFSGGTECAAHIHAPPKISSTINKTAAGCLAMMIMTMRRPQRAQAMSE